MDGDLTTEARNPRTTNIAALPTAALVDLILREDAEIVPAVAAEQAVIARAINGITARLERGGRLLYLGAGTSGRLGVLDASECPPTFGTPPAMVIGIIAGGADALQRAMEGAEDDIAQAIDDLERHDIGADDAVVAISASGRTPYAVAGLQHARACGAFTVALACNPDTPLAAAADVAIAPQVGPEVIAGSTRMKAGTATKLVLNLLSTGTMIRLGRTHGNLMADLRAGSDKLRHRAVQIVSDVTGGDEALARQLLERAGGDVRGATIWHRLMNGEPVYHLTSTEEWEAARASGTHAPASLTIEGFVHCSLREQVLGSARRHFAAASELLLLAIDSNLSDAEIRLERAAGRGPYPHLYGPVDPKTVVNTYPLRRSASGDFVLPPALGGES